MRRPQIVHAFEIDQQAVAITFDDGPNETFTPEILSIFREHQAKATFFMVGEQVQKAPHVAKLVGQEGHEIGNHTFTHPFLTKLSKEACTEELSRTDALLKEVVGVSPNVFRPPYFDYNDLVSESVEAFGYKVIGAVNTEARDWDEPGIEHIVTKTLEVVKPGSILIFHDGFENRVQTVEAVRILVEDLTIQGYKLVTVSELQRMSVG